MAGCLNVFVQDLLERMMRGSTRWVLKRAKASGMPEARRLNSPPRFEPPLVSPKVLQALQARNGYFVFSKMASSLDAVGAPPAVAG